MKLLIDYFWVFFQKMNSLCGHLHKNMFFNHNIRQNLHISVLILCFIFNIHLPIYTHVGFNPKRSPRILYLSIILESLKKTLVYHAYTTKPTDSLTYQIVHSQANFQNKD